MKQLLCLTFPSERPSRGCPLVSSGCGNGLGPNLPKRLEKNMMYETNPDSGQKLNNELHSGKHGMSGAGDKSKLFIAGYVIAEALVIAIFIWKTIASN